MSVEKEPCIQDDPENDNRDKGKYGRGFVPQLRDEYRYSATPCPADMANVDTEELEKLEEAMNEMNEKKEAEKAAKMSGVTPCEDSSQPNPATPCEKDPNQPASLPQQLPPVTILPQPIFSSLFGANMAGA